MARIQVIDQPLAVGRDTPTPYGPRIEGTSTGDLLLSQGLRQLGESADKFVAEAQRAEAQTRALRVTEFNNKFMRESREMLHGEGGYFTKNGFDALNTAGAHQSVDSVIRRYAEQLSDEKSRALFEAEAGSHALTLHTEIERHAGQQRQAYSKQVRDETVETVIWEAQRYVNQPDKVQAVIEDAMPKLVALNQALGLNSLQQTKALMGHIYASVLSQFVADGKATLGQALLDAPVPFLKDTTVKTAMGPLGDKIEQAIAAAAADERGQMFATDALTKYGNNYKAAYDFIAQEAAKVVHGDLTGTFKNAREAKVALDFLKADQASRVDIRDRTQHTVVNDGINWFERHPDPRTGKPVSWDTFVATAPPLLKAQLRANEGFEQLHQWRLRLDQMELNAPPTPEQDFALLKFMEFKNNQDETFAALDPSALFKWRAQLHPDQWKLASHMWDAVAQKNGPVYQMGKKLEGAVMNILEQQGIIPDRSIPGGEQRGKPDTWTPEHRRIWETALLSAYDNFNQFRRDNQGKAPDLKQTFEIASAAASGRAYVEKRLLGIIPYRGETTVPEAMAGNQPLLGVVELSPDSPLYQQYLTAWRKANPDVPNPPQSTINALYYRAVAQSIRYGGRPDVAAAIESQAEKLEK